MNLTQKLLAFVVLLVVLSLGARFYQTTNLPYHAVVPITIAPGGWVVVYPTVDGKTMEGGMILWLEGVPTYVNRPANLFAEQQGFTTRRSRQATFQLGSYTATRPIEPRGFAPMRFPGDGGHLGSSIFDGLENPARLTLDFRAKTLTIDWLPTRPRLCATKGGTLLPLHDDGIDVKCLDSVPARLGIATSSPRSAISTAIWKDIVKWATQHPDVDRKHTELSQTAKTPRCAVTIGARTEYISNMVGQGYLGVLGMDILQKYVVSMDYRDRLVLLTPSTK